MKPPVPDNLNPRSGDAERPPEHAPLPGRRPEERERRPQGEKDEQPERRRRPQRRYITY